MDGYRARDPLIFSGSSSGGYYVQAPKPPKFIKTAEENDDIAIFLASFQEFMEGFNIAKEVWPMHLIVMLNRGAKAKYEGMDAMD